MTRTNLAAVDSLVEENVVPLSRLKAVADAYAVAIVDNAHKARADQAHLADAPAHMARAMTEIAADWDLYRSNLQRPAEIELAGAVESAMSAAAAPLDRLSGILAGKDMPALVQFIERELYPAIDPISDAVSDLIDYNVEAALVEQAQIDRFGSLVLMLIGGIALVVLGVSAYAARVTLVSVARRLTTMQMTMAYIAAGNVDAVVPYTDDKDEIGSMALAAERFRANAARIVETAEKELEAASAALDTGAKLDAVSRSQAIIEFEPDGTIITANENFCRALGYELSELVGKHHRLFVDPAYAASSDYAEFWKRLGSGQYDASEYPRIGKDGRTIWINASYNPVFDRAGQVVKVVKFATDVTARKQAVDTVGASLASLAEGDLSHTIDMTFPAELEPVRAAFNETVGRISEIVAQLQNTSRALRTATGEILAGANDLAERTTRQAAAVEETSAAVEQLATTITDNAERAGSASESARAVSGLANEAGDVMSRATDGMEAIASSSSKISNIIGMIDDIAFQTNLLALNASVEAARAGEAGKGFAVVAIEVRRLAQSAATASSEVKALIEKSSQQVGAGAKLVSEAASRVAAMLDGIKENGRHIEAIASATAEQASTLKEVTVAVRQIDEMTQHNAALVEETNAAIEQTESQAAALDAIVDVFELGSDDTRPVREDATVKPTPVGLKRVG
nr:methyl-accepting chemotaxis protein [Pelagibacterium limicola]